MAYVPTRTTYRLVFESPEHNGLEVITKAGSVGEYMEIAKLADLDWTPPFTAEQMERVHELYAAFCKVLISWNIEEPAGKPVPATLRGFKSLEMPLGGAIVLAWLEAAAGQAGPLDRTDGDLEASLPMDVAS